MNIYVSSMHLKLKCIIVVYHDYLSRLTKILLHFNCIRLCPSMSRILTIYWNLITGIHSWCRKSWSITSCRSYRSSNFLLARHFFLIIVNSALSFMNLLLIELLLEKCSLLRNIRRFGSFIKWLFSANLWRNALLNLQRILSTRRSFTFTNFSCIHN